MQEELIPIKALPWFRLHFLENEGMAYGWKLGGSFGKIALTLFRLIAVGFGTYYIISILKKGIITDTSFVLRSFMPVPLATSSIVYFTD